MTVAQIVGVARRVYWGAGRDRGCHIDRRVMSSCGVKGNVQLCSLVN